MTDDSGVDERCGGCYASAPGRGGGGEGHILLARNPAGERLLTTRASTRGARARKVLLELDGLQHRESLCDQHHHECGVLMIGDDVTHGSPPRTLTHGAQRGHPGESRRLKVVSEPHHRMRRPKSNESSPKEH